MSPPLKILLVEDSPDDVFFFRRAVNKAGIVAETQVAVDGLEAINYLTNQGQYLDAEKFGPPRVIFLDLKLPHVNGFELLNGCATTGSGGFHPSLCSLPPTNRKTASAPPAWALRYS
jgi:CheY-like chemotaxis protein